MAGLPDPADQPGPAHWTSLMALEWELDPTWVEQADAAMLLRDVLMLVDTDPVFVARLRDLIAHLPRAQPCQHTDH